MLYKRILFLLLASVLTTSVGAWNKTGHKISALMVWQQLSNEQRAWIIEILEKHPRYQRDFIDSQPDQLDPNDQPAWRFAQASIWPDRVRRFSGTLKDRYHRPRWHYINIPVYDSSSGKASPSRDSIDEPSGSQHASDLDAVRAFNHNWGILSDASASGPERAIALCWVLHIGADVHQPLHTASLVSPRWFANGDRGGNEIAVRFLGDQPRVGDTHNSAKQNLHWVWDNMLGRSMTWSAIVQLSMQLPQRYSTVASTAAADSAIDDWVASSHHLAETLIYTPALLNQLATQSARNPPLPVIRLPESYRRMHRPAAEQQLLLSSIRLATMLGRLKR